MNSNHQSEQELMILLLLLFEENGFRETSWAFKQEYQKKLLKSKDEVKDFVRMRVNWKGNLKPETPFQLVGLGDDVSDHGLLKISKRAAHHGNDHSSYLDQFLDKSRIEHLHYSGENRFQKLCSVQGHLAPVFCSLFDGTGNRIFTGGDDNLVKMWDVKSGLLLRTLRAHKTSVGNDTGVIVDLAINPQNTLLATCSSDKSIRIWNISNFEPLDRILLTKPITSIEFSKSMDENSPLLLLVTSNDSKVRIYQEECGKNGVFLKEAIYANSGILLRDQVSSISTDSIGFFMASAGGDGILYLFSLYESTGTNIGTFESHLAPVTDVVLSTSGLRMVSGCKNGRLVFYRFDMDKKGWSVFHKAQEERCPSSDSLGLEMKATLFDSRFDSSDLLVNQPLNTIPPNITSLLYDGDETQIPFLERTNGLSAEKIVEVVTLIFNCCESLVISSFSDFTIKVWDFKTGEKIQSLIGHQSGVVILDCHPSIDHLLLSGCLNGKINLWNLTSGQILYKYEFTDSLLSGSFSPTGDYISITDSKGNLHMFGHSSLQENYLQVPVEQFFLLDWKPVIENSTGQLLDEQSNQLAHLEPMGELTCRNRIPSILQVSWMLLQKDFQTFNYIIELNHERRQQLYHLEKDMFDSFIDIAKTFGGSLRKKDLLKRRRQLKTDGPEINTEYTIPPIVDQPDFLSIPMAPIPDSSGDEYSGESGNTDAVSDMWLEDFHGTKHLDDAFLNDDDESPLDGPILERTARHRKRTRASAILSDSDPSDIMNHQEQHEDQSRKRVKRVSMKPGFFRIDDSEDDNDWQDDSNTPMMEAGPSTSSTAVAVSVTNPKKKLIKKVDPPIWLSSSIPETSYYVPQIGDVVVYFKGGHLDLLKSLQPTEIESTLDSVNEMFLGKVLSIEYLSGIQVSCEIKLAVSEEMIEDYTQISWSEMKTVDIVIYDSNGLPDFFIFANYYFSSLQTPLSVGETCVGRFADGDHEIVVKQVLPDVMWNKYTVTFKSNDETEDTEPFFMNPWEIRKIDQEWTELPALPQEGFFIIPLRWLIHVDIEKERFLSIICESIENSEGNLHLFLDPVPYKEYPTYLVFVAYPLYIRFIQARLESNYYRQKEQVFWEWNQMCVNVTLYNDPSALVSEHAKRYLYPILDLLEGKPARIYNAESSSLSVLPPLNEEVKEEEIDMIQVSRKPGLRIRFSSKKPVRMRKSARNIKPRVMKLSESSESYEEDQNLVDSDEVDDIYP